MATKKTTNPSEASAEAQPQVPRKVVEETAVTGEEIRRKLFDIRNLTEGIRLIAENMGVVILNNVIKSLSPSFNNDSTAAKAT